MLGGGAGVRRGSWSMSDSLARGGPWPLCRRIKDQGAEGGSKDEVVRLVVLVRKDGLPAGFGCRQEVIRRRWMGAGASFCRTSVAFPCRA